MVGLVEKRTSIEGEGLLQEGGHAGPPILAGGLGLTQEPFEAPLVHPDPLRVEAQLTAAQLHRLGVSQPLPEALKRSNQGPVGRISLGVGPQEVGEAPLGHVLPA